jgi:hypothetical protein
MGGIGRAGLCLGLILAAACESSSNRPMTRAIDDMALGPRGDEIGDDEVDIPAPDPSSEVVNPIGFAVPGEPPTNTKMDPTPEVPPTISPMGGPCGASAVCESGLRCFGAPNNGALFEAVPGGYCSVACAADEDCASVGAGSWCYRDGFCTVPCSAYSDPESDAPKCGGRIGELNCFGFDAEGSCLPSCESDEVCGPGRECYYGSGSCLLSGRSKVLNDEAPIGAVCNPEPSPFTCRGYCLRNGDDSASLCSGICSVGAERCGGDASNLCVPFFLGGRHGDRGNCYKACQTSADCGLAPGECVPSALLTAAGAETGYCNPLRASVPSFLPTRLSVEDMQQLSGAANVRFIETFVYREASSRIFVENGEACITGEVADTPEADASLAHLAFQFGLIDPPTPRDVSGSEALSITLTSDRAVYIYATQVGHPPFEYGSFVFQSLTEPQTLRFTHDELFPGQVGAPPWNPALLDNVGLRLASGVGPFRLCVSRIAFE